MTGYKLRLGDGTTFSVDEKGLLTWLQGGLVDSKARVQPDGSKKWFSVQQVLAAAAGTNRPKIEREDADRAAAAEVATMEKKVARERAAEERKAIQDGTIGERRAAEAAAAAERLAREEREAEELREEAERAAEEERAAAEAEARRAEEEKAAEERRAAEEAAEAERLEAEALEAARTAEAERLAAEELASRRRRAEEEKLARKADEERAAAEKAAAEKAAAEAAAERAAAERAAAEKRAAEKKAAEKAEAERGAAEKRAAEQRAAEKAAAEKAAAERRAAEKEAAEKAAAEQAAARQAAVEKAGAERAAAERKAVAERHAAEERAALDSIAPFALPETEIPLEPVAMPARERSFDGDLESFHKELALVPVAPPDVRPAPSRPSAASPTAGRDRPSFGMEAESTTARPASTQGPLAATLTTLGSALARGLEAAAPAAAAAAAWTTRTWRSLAGRMASLKSTLASRASASVAPPPAADATAVPPSPPPPVPAPSRATAAPVVVEPLAAGTASERSPTPAPAPPRPAPTPPPASVTARPPAPSVAAASPSPRVGAPPSFHDMPVIPFADPTVGRKSAERHTGDERDEEQIYDDGDDGPSAFATLWLWVKRATIVLALLVTAAVLAARREAWEPQARAAALVLFQKVDALTSRAMAKEVPPAAVEAAALQLPHLRTDTIVLVMERANKGGLPATEVFRRANDAAVAGRAALGQAGSEELDALTALLAAELPAAERERLTRYLARVRAGGVTASYEDQEAVWLLGRAGRIFPEDRRARLQELNAKAVIAGLPAPR